MGCGGPDHVLQDRAIVRGKVTLDGQPLNGGTLNFQSTERAVGATVIIRGGGVFATDRAPLGKNLVTVDTESLKVAGGGYVPIPEKYRQAKTTDLTVEVQPGENNDVTIALVK